MKKILLSLAAVSALAAAAAPAAAQSYRDDGYRNGYNPQRSENLEMRIERAVERGQITPREARNLHAELRDAQRVEWRYRRDGRLTRYERADLDQRFDRVQALLRMERRDQDYGYGYGYRR